LARRDVGGPWLCVPGAGMGRCREARRDVGGPWLCVPGAGMGCCREAGREWWYAGQSGPLSRYDPQYHAHATKRWQCGGREGGPHWTGRAPCLRSERYHWHFLVWAGAVTLVASGGALDKTGPHDATTRNTTRTPPNGGSVAVASGARFGQAAPHAADQRGITGTPLPMHLSHAQWMVVALACR
jgi:hypothetical protein